MNIKPTTSELNQHGSDSAPVLLGPRADNVWRLFPARGTESEIASRLDTIAQTLAASRSIVLARLVTLRLMSADNPVRSHLTRVTVSSAQKVLLAEEKVVDTIVSKAGLKISSGANYCSTHLRLQLLQNFEPKTEDGASELDRWELVISELIHYVQACANYVQRVTASAAGDEIDSDKLEQQLSDLMKDDKRRNAP